MIRLIAFNLFPFYTYVLVDVLIANVLRKNKELINDLVHESEMKIWSM